jgi:hypothetical protein
MFLREFLASEVPKENIFLFAMVTPIRIGADKINCHLDEFRVNLLLLLNEGKLFPHHINHSLDESVFNHQRGDRHHLEWFSLLNSEVIFY